LLTFLFLDFPSSRLELEAVADIFDLDKDGFIDYKEFLATLKPTTVNNTINLNFSKSKITYSYFFYAKIGYCSECRKN
jgi:hypothetical protein